MAADTSTRQVGGTVTSCVGATSVAFVHGSAPGFGAINAQAAANTAGRDRGVTLLRMGVAPADIIAMITAPAFDRNAASRQYGVADLAGRAAGWTGSAAQDYKEDRQGTVGAFTYSVQGNILTGKAVIDQAEAAFRGSGCVLAERLIRALEGGAQNGQGDSRCTTTKNIPSDSISIQVDPEGMASGSCLELALSGTGIRNPVVLMRAMFDDWRLTHPCPGAAPPDGSAGDDAATGDDAAAGRAEAGDAETGGPAGGCGCRTDAGTSPAGLALVVFLLALRLVRRRAR